MTLTNFIFNYLVHISGFVAGVVFISKWKSLVKEEVWIGILILISFGFDFIAGIVALKNINNLWIYNIAVAVQLFFLSIIYHSLLTSAKAKMFIQLFFVLYLTSHVVIVSVQGIGVFDIYSYIAACFAVAITAYLYLKQLLQSDNTPSHNLYFWFGCATLFDYIVSVPLLSLLTWPAFKDDINKYLYIINEVLYSAWFLLISVGLLWTKRRI